MNLNNKSTQIPNEGYNLTKHSFHSSREEKEGMCTWGHVMDSGGVYSLTGWATIILPRSSDLAKLNLKCHVNYSNYL